jgi:hypothetical protein
MDTHAMKSLPTSFDQIERFLKTRNIDTGAIAFYNDPNFLAAEQSEPAFLEFYAVFVRLRDRDAAYDSLVRSIVPRMVAKLADEIQRDGQKGVCIDASMMLMKMLELHGVWSYAVNGALTIHSPSLPSPTHFWPIDVTPVAGHVWLVVPPYELVDVSLACQPYFRGEHAFLPPYLIAEGGKRITPQASDYCSSELLAKLRKEHGPLPKDIHYRLNPGLQRRVKYFPSYEIVSGTAKLHYCAGGVSASDAPSLQAIQSRRWNSLLASELYDQVIKPEISSAQ